MADSTRPRKSGDERVDNILKWLQEHQRAVTVAAVAIVVIGGGIWFSVTAKARKEAFAARELLQARNAADVGNLPLAANDLSRLISAYGGTPAAEEATLLLAQVRMQQGSPDVAAATLRDFLGQRPRDRFRAAGYSLLATALEQTGSLTQAAEAYENGADATEYELVALQLLLEAARAWQMAGDTARASSTYERIIRDHPDAPGLSEVRIRLGELRRTDIAS